MPGNGLGIEVHIKRALSLDFATELRFICTSGILPYQRVAQLVVMSDQTWNHPCYLMGPEVGLLHPQSLLTMQNNAKPARAGGPGSALSFTLNVWP